jgi:thiamine-phosphate pyrophosphorylase
MMDSTHKGRQRDALVATRFYGILDTAYVAAERWTIVCSQLIAGGAGLVQVRAKNSSRAGREDLVQKVIHLFDRKSGKPPFLIINDDADLCASVAGAGLHIGQDDIPPIDARKQIGPDRVLGLSTHSQAQAEDAMNLPNGILDYFCIGPVYATQTKPDYTPVGLDLVRWTAGKRPDLPWFCIGGINRGNLREVVSAGAQRVVVVSDVLMDPDPAAAIRAISAGF